MALKIATLCSDGPHHEYLVARLAQTDEFRMPLVVVEPALEQRRRLLRSGKRRDYLWWTWHAVRRRLLGLDDYRRRFFADTPALTPGRIGRTMRMAWINDPSVAEALSLVEPDVTVVMGTSILGPQALAAAGRRVINVHGGYLPWYRGNQCFFFALVDGRLDRVGSTIHFVERGVDTGDIIERIVPKVDSGDQAEVLYCRAERRAVDRLVGLLRGLDRGVPLPRDPQGPGGRLYRMRDRKPRHDLLLWLRRRRQAGTRRQRRGPAGRGGGRLWPPFVILRKARARPGPAPSALGQMPERLSGGVSVWPTSLNPHLWRRKLC